MMMTIIIAICNRIGSVHPVHPQCMRMYPTIEGISVVQPVRGLLILLDVHLALPDSSLAGDGFNSLSFTDQPSSRYDINIVERDVNSISAMRVSSAIRLTQLKLYMLWS